MFRCAPLIAAVAAAASVWGGPAWAQAQSGADLSMSPKRVVFGPADRAATLYIFNRGSEAATYGLSVTDQVMTPDGRIRTPEELALVPEAATALANLKSAKELVSFSPRRVTLQPGQSQTIRLRVLRPGDLTIGEYRTHLTITAVPSEDAGLTAEQAVQTDDGQLAVKIVTLFSVALPVIVRQGKPEVAAGIEGFSFETRPPVDKAEKPVGVLSLDLLRLAPNSLYGDVEVRAMKGSKPGAMIGVARGVGVYPEIDRRRLSIPLTVAPAPGDKLQVLFRDDDSRPGTAIATVSYTTP